MPQRHSKAVIIVLLRGVREDIGTLQHALARDPQTIVDPLDWQRAVEHGLHRIAHDLALLHDLSTEYLTSSVQMRIPLERALLIGTEQAVKQRQMMAALLDEADTQIATVLAMLA